MKRIGKVVDELSVSADTLRYYEEIGLLDKIHRSKGGIRLYEQDDLKRILFIKQTQKVGFSLEEIRQLLNFRDHPQQAKPHVRKLVSQKLGDIEIQIEALTKLRDELSHLTQLCIASSRDCPILSKFESP
jgi:MerR family copper efflux transcriptional regulator